MSGWDFLLACFVVFVAPPALAAIFSAAATATVGVIMFKDSTYEFFWGGFVATVFPLFICAVGMMFF